MCRVNEISDFRLYIHTVINNRIKIVFHNFYLNERIFDIQWQLNFLFQLLRCTMGPEAGNIIELQKSIIKYFL